MWHEVTKTYDLDLSLPGDQLWEQVIAEDLPAARCVAEAALEDFRQQAWAEPWWRWARKGLAYVYRTKGHAYADEIGAWADALGMPFHDLLTLQCSYELQHAAEWLAYKLHLNRPLTPMGCTAGMIWKSVHGPIHVRSMDWPIPEIGQATRLFRFHYGEHQFVSVGILGFMGVISGMVPGSYSCTINWAPPTGIPSLHNAPSFLLREALTQQPDFHGAVHQLQQTPLATNVLYAICSSRQGGCRVIERLANSYAVRNGGMPEHSPVTVANHFECKKLLACNKVIEYDPYTMEDSQFRALTLRGQLECRRDEPVRDIAEALEADPVLNEGSVQQMLFDVRMGQTYAWAYVP